MSGPQELILPGRFPSQLLFRRALVHDRYPKYLTPASNIGW